MDRAFFGRGLQRMDWLSVLSAGAEVWKAVDGVVVVVVVVVDVVRGRKSENVARDGKGVRNGVGREMALSNDSITAQVQFNSKNEVRTGG